MLDQAWLTSCIQCWEVGGQESATNVKNCELFKRSCSFSWVIATNINLKATWMTEGDYVGHSAAKHSLQRPSCQVCLRTEPHNFSQTRISSQPPELYNLHCLTIMVVMVCRTCDEKTLWVVEVQPAKERGPEGAISSRCLFNMLTQLHQLKM